MNNKIGKVLAPLLVSCCLFATVMCDTADASHGRRGVFGIRGRVQNRVAFRQDFRAVAAFNAAAFRASFHAPFVGSGIVIPPSFGFTQRVIVPSAPAFYAPPAVQYVAPPPAVYAPQPYSAPAYRAPVANTQPRNAEVTIRLFLD